MTPCSVALAAHPDTPCPAVTGIHVNVERTGSGGLRLSYTLNADLSALRIPRSVSGVRRDGLWRHTCFEAFLLGADGHAYREFNFSPSGDWQAYDFRAYRDGGDQPAIDPPRIERSESSGQLCLTITLAPSALPDARSLALATVIETLAGPVSYWALRHAPGQPDFHHTDAFALELT